MDIQAVYWAAPPVTRTIVTLTLVQSLLVIGGLLSSYYVLFVPGLVFKFPPEIWRLVTPFLLTGPKLNFFFDLYFMFTYGSHLERKSARLSHPGDFFVYLVFVASSILLTSGFYLGNYVLTSALIMAMIYTYSLDNRGTTTHLLFIQIRVEYLPWAMLVIAFVSNGWDAALAESMGIVAAHQWEFLTRIWPAFGGGKDYLKTPAVVRRYFARYTEDVGRREYGRFWRPSQPHEAREGANTERPPLPDSWRSWGSGQRLGGG
ncbi:hypothetical protein N7468_004948 [Penicillium chermesinum]|uniref:Derlin n=1 Tax=Penicillium chermesinum TaxID=63820 RepID=A0A9W9NYD0_9EURO|nr:uncharacterized protein N7468_004948 [Penicillium chermesinum]KAJ5231992.1 hypothetical protein N7468_004948 [Penicillium chermesinum]